MLSTNSSTALRTLSILSAIAVTGVLVLWILIARRVLLGSSPRRFDLYLLCVYAAVTGIVALLACLIKPKQLFTLTACALMLAVIVITTLSGSAPAILILIWLVLVARTIGLLALKLLKSDVVEDEPDRTAISIAIGFGIVSLIVFAIGTAGLLYSTSAWILLVLLSIPTLFEFRKCAFNERLSSIREGMSSLEVRDQRIVAFLSVFASISFLGSLMWALTPETEFDALNYNLAIPQIFVENHSLIEVPYTFWSYLLGSTGMLYSLALLLTGQPLPQLIHLTFGLVLGGLTFGFARRLAGLKVAFVSSAIVYTLPMVAWESRTSYIDLIVAAYAFGAFLAAWHWYQGGRDGWLTITGLLSGFGIAAKYSAIAALAPALLIILYRCFRRLQWRRVVAAGLRVALPTLLVSAPWFLMRFVWTGNPVFPLFNNLFKSSEWPPVNETFGYVWETDLISFLLTPWRLSGSHYLLNSREAPLLGVLPLLAVVSLLLLTHEKTRILIGPVLISFFVGLAVWFTTAQFSRFLLGLMPLASFAAAILLAPPPGYAIDGALTRSIRVAALGLIVALAVALGLRINSSALIPERLPYRVLLRLESREEYLRRALPVYETFEFLNKKDSPPKVLSVGNEFKLYTSAQIVGIHGSRVAAEVLQMRSEEELKAFLSREAFDYILIDRSEATKLPHSENLLILNPEILSRLATLESGRNRFQLYRVLP